LLHPPRSLCRLVCSRGTYDVRLQVRATTDAEEALRDVQYIVHAIPVQSSRAYLTRLAPLIGASTPIFSLSKGLEVGTGQIMTEIIDSSLGRKHPIVVLSGPSFAVELMQVRGHNPVCSCEKL
jgi:glycerol-3-phosphate dehydrogenase (NAD+)